MEQDHSSEDPPTVGEVLENLDIVLGMPPDEWRAADVEQTRLRAEIGELEAKRTELSAKVARGEATAHELQLIETLLTDAQGELEASEQSSTSSDYPDDE